MALLISGLPTCACQVAQTPSSALGDEGQTCRLGDRVIRECREPLTCRTQLSTTPEAPNQQIRSPVVSVGAGGLCGYQLHARCAEGLECSMTTEQQNIANGMGTCEHASKCMR